MQSNERAGDSPDHRRVRPTGTLGAVSPDPSADHINFLPKDGLEQLFARAGLVDIGISKPGELDVDIVRNAMERLPVNSECRRIVDALVPDEQSATSLQEHLRQHRLSLHAWAMACRPPATA